MPKNIRQRISHAIQNTFRLSPQHKPSSSVKSKLTYCCSVKKPNDYEFVSYQPKQTRKQIPKNHDYIDLSECHSWSSSYSKDSGISINSNEKSHPLQSTKIYSDDSSELSTIFNLSYIRHNEMNISYSDITTQRSTFQCCRCQCHHYIDNNHLFAPENYQDERIKTKIYPFIF